MINHVRTLLLNESGQSGPHAGNIAEAYVPTDYRPVVVPSAAAVVRKACFGDNPDRNLKNYRLRQLLTMLHGTELAEFATRFDSRLTYLPFAKDDLFDRLFKLQVKTTLPPSNADGGMTDLLSLLFIFPLSAIPSTLNQEFENDGTFFLVQGSPELKQGEQPLYQKWKIVNDGSSVLIFRRAPGHDIAPAVTQTLVFGEAGLSQQITLPGSSVAIRLLEASVGGNWEVTLAVRPPGDLSDVLKNLESQIGGTVAAGLFGPAPRGDYKVFSDVWRSHQQLPYKISAAVLAAAYRLEENRLQGLFA